MAFIQIYAKVKLKRQNWNKKNVDYKMKKINKISRCRKS